MGNLLFRFDSCNKSKLSDSFSKPDSFSRPDSFSKPDSFSRPDSFGKPDSFSFETRATIDFSFNSQESITRYEEYVTYVVNRVIVGDSKPTHHQLKEIMLSLGEQITQEEAEEMLSQINLRLTCHQLGGGETIGR